jgi:hypothetical protein
MESARQSSDWTALGHLNENATIAIKFKPMNEGARAKLSKTACSALAAVPVPWERAGYTDGERIA